MEEVKYDHGTCRCGRHADKTSSGSPECWACWNRRKLDLPAAAYWSDRIRHLLENVDLYDVMTYLPSCGLSNEEVQEFGRLLNVVKNHSDRIIEEGMTVPLQEEAS